MAGAGRSAIGNIGGSLARLSTSEVASQLIPHEVTKVEINPALIGEVILGQVLTAGCGQNTARQTSLNPGLDELVPAISINKVCGSGINDGAAVVVLSGAISLRHQMGASGCRVLITLWLEMIKSEVNRGLSMLCISGDQGITLAIKR